MEVAEWFLLASHYGQDSSLILPSSYNSLIVFKAVGLNWMNGISVELCFLHSSVENLHKFPTNF